MNKKKISLVKDFPEKLICTVCFLPMQYQTKKNDSFLWQCFKCGKKYLVSGQPGDYTMEETFSPPR